MTKTKLNQCPFDADCEAYARGKADGIEEAAKQIQALNLSIAQAHTTILELEEKINRATSILKNLSVIYDITRAIGILEE